MKVESKTNKELIRELVALRRRITELEQSESERKQMEEALRESEEKFSTLVRQAKDGVILIQDNILTFANEAMADILGYTLDEIENTPYINYVARESQSMVSEQVNARLANKEVPQFYEARLLRKDGTVIDAELSAKVIQYRGKPVDVGIVRDITERKRAEEALRKSEETLKLITDNMSDMVRVVDLQGNNLYATPSHYSVLGYKPEDRVGKSTFDIVHPDDVENMIRVFSESIARRQPAMTEYRVRHADGHYVWLETAGDPIWNDKGELTAVVVSARDISERKASEERLRKSEERYRVLAYSIDSMYLVDPECRYLFVNEGYRQRIGIPLEEIIGRRYDEFHPKEDAREFTEKVKEVYESGIPIQHEYNSEWDERCFLRTFSPVMDQEGKSINAVTVVSKDITERKRLEAQLLQAQKMEALGTLTGGIAHDFNNILSAMIGYTELTMKEPDEERRQHNLRQVLRSCDRARDLVAQILTFSHSTSQEYKPIETGPVIKEGLELLRASLPATIRIRQEIAPEPAIISGDPTRIHQILMNLCANAAHAMGAKGGLLDVGLSPVEILTPEIFSTSDLQAGSYVKLAVSDTGHGIDPAIMNRIFDPFFTTKKPGEGTGLGLSVVYGIVKSHGGAITVQSELGKGSVFNVYFPKIQVAVQPEIHDLKDLPRGKERILFIDDEPYLAEMGEMMLETLGYDVVSCTNSAEAFDSFVNHHNRFDLVITDMTMPAMTGAELAREILRTNPEMPIILCTGHSEFINERKAREMGIREFLMKPISMKVLAYVVRKIMDEKQES